MARKPLRPLIRSGGFYPSRKWTPLVYAGGYTTANGGGEPEPPPIEKTVTGNPIHITDALAKPAQALSIALEPIQDLHGYDSPWPAGGGKNKLNNQGVSATVSNVAYTVQSDGSVKTSGTSNGWNKFNLGNQTLPAGEYIMSSGVSAEYQYNQFLTATINGTAYETNNGNITLTLTAETTFAIGIVTRPNTAPNQTVYPMIRLSSVTDATYSPYSNICPISGHTDADVTRTGKNLCGEAFTHGIYVISNGTYYSHEDSASRYVSIGIIPVKGGQTYTFSWLDDSGNTASTGSAAFYNGNEFVSGKTLNGTKQISVPENANGVAINLLSTTSITSISQISISNPQLELGSTATAYEEYRGTTYPIPLGTTVYGGTLDVLTGVLTVTMASVDLGTLTYTYMSLSGGRNAFIAHIDGIVPHASNAVPINAISSAYKAVSYNATWTSGDMSYTRNAGGTDDKQQVTFVNNDYTDAAAFKTAMAGQTLCYELATPTTIQLTPTQVELLLGENNLFSYGEMTLVYLADGNASDEEALNILLGGRYVNNHEADEPTDREALNIILGGNER